MRRPLSTLPLLLLLTACAHGEGAVRSGDIDAAAAVYAELEAAVHPKGFLASRNCFEADRLLAELQRRFPYHRYTAEGELLAAECAAAEGRLYEAIGRWEGFLTLHPTHPRIHEVEVAIAEAYLELTDGPDRDLGPAYQALARADQVLRSVPAGRWAERALAVRKRARALLAEHELYVARFYRREGKLLAARDRYLVVVRQYRELPAAARARTELAAIEARLGLVAPETGDQLDEHPRID